jgi:hypothetical protein
MNDPQIPTSGAPMRYDPADLDDLFANLARTQARLRRYHLGSQALSELARLYPQHLSHLSRFLGAQHDLAMSPCFLELIDKERLGRLESPGTQADAGEDDVSFQPLPCGPDTGGGRGGTGHDS